MADNSTFFWILFIFFIFFLIPKLSGGIAYAAMKKPLAKYKDDFNDDFATKAVDMSKEYNRPALIRAGAVGKKLSKEPIHSRQIQGYKDCRTFDKDGDDADDGEYVKLYVGRPYEGYRSRLHKNDTTCSHGKKYNIPTMTIPDFYDAECLCEPKAGVDTKNMYKTFLPSDANSDYYNDGMNGFKRFVKGMGLFGS